MKNVYLFELSDIFDNQVYLPYSSGVVWSYVNNNSKISKQYNLKEWFFAREEVESIISRVKSPDYLIFSCFMWNWNLNCQLAQKLKKLFPECKVIFGGQHQPLADRNTGFFLKHPYVDILIHNEGEITLEEILLGHSLKDIEGITYQENKKEIATPPRKRMKDISLSPSPYLDGSFDLLLQKNKENKNYSFHATVESVRGCPFSCAFCEIGEDYYKKVITSHEKTKKEIDWIAKNKIEYVTDANSNYGLLFDRDYSLAEYVVKVKANTGFPKAYRVTWAKGQADKVLEIAKLFELHNIQKGMTIALQSMNEDVLKAVKRKNVHSGKLKEFIDTYEKENISSYVELIWGLPEESLNSFIDGVCHIMSEGYHNYLDIHLMMVLPNSPISFPGYSERYGIKTVAVQPRFSHRSNPENLVEDLVPFVIETSACSLEEWIDGHQFRWIIIFGHYLGPLQFIARALVKLNLTNFKDFYISLLEFASENCNTFLGQEYLNIKNNLKEILKNKRHWGDVIEGAGDINWEVDEASCIRLTSKKKLFYRELKGFILKKYNVKENLLDDILNYQNSRLHDPGTKYPIKSKFNYNIHQFISDESSLVKKESIYEFDGLNYSNLYEWAKNVLWFGRRIARYKTKVSVIR